MGSGWRWREVRFPQKKYSRRGASLDGPFFVRHGYLRQGQGAEGCGRSFRRRCIVPESRSVEWPSDGWEADWRPGDPGPVPPGWVDVRAEADRRRASTGPEVGRPPGGEGRGSTTPPG